MCGEDDSCAYDRENGWDLDFLCGNDDICAYDANNDADSDMLCYMDCDFSANFGLGHFIFSENDYACHIVDSCPHDVENDVDSDEMCGDIDSCAYDTEKDADSDVICGDVDSCMHDNENDADSDNVCADVDSCAYDVENDADSDLICGNLDSCMFDKDNDMDSDLTCRDIDSCSDDAKNDMDSDALCANIDSCMYDSNNDADSDNICGDIDICPDDAENDINNNGICGSEPCQGTWMSWANCSLSCGGGSQKRIYVVLSPAVSGGEGCRFANMHSEAKDCGRQACPVDCFGHWASWGLCNSNCSKYRSFEVQKLAADGGQECSEITHSNYSVEQRSCIDGYCNQFTSVNLQVSIFNATSTELVPALTKVCNSFVGINSNQSCTQRDLNCDTSVLESSNMTMSTTFDLEVTYETIGQEDCTEDIQATTLSNRVYDNTDLGKKLGSECPLDCDSCQDAFSVSTVSTSPIDINDICSGQLVDSFITSDLLFALQIEDILNGISDINNATLTSTTATINVVIETDFSAGVIMSMLEDAIESSDVFEVIESFESLSFTTMGTTTL